MPAAYGLDVGVPPGAPHSPAIRITSCGRRSASPGGRLQRAGSPYRSGGSVNGGERPPSPAQRLARDPTQPSHGSLLSVHSACSSDSEESDSFSLVMPPRPRSHTSPEVVVERRRARARLHARPPTPPPLDLSPPRHDARLDVGKLRDVHRSLPELPEWQALEVGAPLGSREETERAQSCEPIFCPSATLRTGAMSSDGRPL